jgi:hypothetical protein
MKSRDAQNLRVLAIAFNTRGFGFAVLDDAVGLIDWGIKKFKPREQEIALNKIKQLIATYAPDTIVLEDLKAAPFRHAYRIHRLSPAVERLAKSFGIGARKLSLAQVKNTFSYEPLGTKHQIARKLAEHFSDELGHLLPPKRVLWKAEHYRMGIFDAAALAVTFFWITPKS